MRGTFGDGLSRISAAVGTGHLVGSVEVDQVYAHAQHEHPEWNHPEGGGAYYLRDPLFEQIDRSMQGFADALISSEGSGLKESMKTFAEHLSTEVYLRAPVEFSDLRSSGHPKVVDDARVFYDRAPATHRLDESEIEAKNHLRALFGRI